MAYLTRQQALDIINKAPANLNKENLLKELAKTNTIEGYNEQPEKSNILKDIGREIVKPFAQGAELLSSGAKAYGGVLKAGGQLLTGNKAAAQKTLAETEKQAQQRKDVKVLGQNVSRVETPKQAVGTVLNLASNFVGGGGAVKAGGTLLKSGLKAAGIGAKAGAKAGALYGAGEAISNDENVLGGTVKGAIGGAIGGAVIPPVVKGAIGTVKTIASPFSTAIEKIVPSLERVSEKIENVLIKPSKTDINHGFKPENVFKYNLGGNLGQSLKKSDELLTQLRTRATELRGQSKAVIDIQDIMNSVVDDINTGKIESKGAFKEDIIRAFNKWVTEIEDRFPDGKTNTVDAQILKEFIGDLGSWVKGSQDLNANSMEAVSNNLYSKVKTAIENSVGDPKELKEINRQMSEIIPIKLAIQRRLPIAEKNNALGITDMISLGAGVVEPKAWGLFILNRLAKSGTFANIVSKGSQKLKSGATKLLPLEKGAKDYIKNIKPGLTIEDVSRKPLKSTKKLDSLNPTGSVFAKYTPKQRATAELADNITTLDKTMGKSADEMITVYRGSSKGSDIVPGDFITTNKQLAKDYAGNGKVLEKKVKLSDILDDTTEPLGEEYIYRPNKSQPLKSNPLIQEAKKYKSAEEALIARGIKGDDLLDKKDLIDEVINNGGKVNNNGTITLYHYTTPESKKIIEKTGEMFGKEAGIFFSTRAGGQAVGYGNSVIKVDVPIEKLQLDDVFGDEAHLRIPTKKIGEKIKLFNPKK